ncbi:hypothetical protein K5D57_10760 [Pseudomonas cichorii]|nr:hypothetical protein [Pseudomonas cichorii]
MTGMTLTSSLDRLTTDQLRSLAAQLIERVEYLSRHIKRLDKTVLHQKTLNPKLTHELAVLSQAQWA